MKMTASYYRKPEGEDLGGKLSYAVSRSTLAGIGCGIIDTKLYTLPKGYLGTLGRVFYWTWPMVGMSTAFVTTTYIATNLRNKDDRWNYALGGAAAGSIFGTWRRKAGLGTFVAFALAIAAMIKKEAVDNGFVFFPEVKQVQQGVYSPSRDYTLVGHLPGNWTTGKD